MAVLSVKRQNEIDKDIDKLLLQTNTSYPENNLIQIIDKLDIKVKLPSETASDGCDRIRF